MLTAWLATTRRTRKSRELIAVIHELVTVIEAALPGPDSTRRSRDIVKTVTMMAFAESLIGVPLAAMTGDSEPDGRRLTLTFLKAIEDGT